MTDLIGPGRDIRAGTRIIGIDFQHFTHFYFADALLGFQQGTRTGAAPGIYRS